MAPRVPRYPWLFRGHRCRITEYPQWCLAMAPQPGRPLPYSQAPTGLVRLVSIGTMRPLRLPQRFERHSVCHVAPPYLRVIPSVRSPSRGNRRADARVLFNRFTLRFRCFVPRTLSVLPSSLRTLLTFALLLDPGRLLAPDPVQRSDVVPAIATAKTPTIYDFRGSITRL